MRVTALRRKPWGNQPPAAALVAAAPGGRQQPGEAAVEGMEEDGAEQAEQQMQQDGGQPAAVQDAQQPAARLHGAHDPELDAAAEAVLADRGCWPADSARLATQADIIAGEAGRAGWVAAIAGCITRPCWDPAYA